MSTQSGRCELNAAPDLPDLAPQSAPDTILQRHIDLWLANLQCQRGERPAPAAALRRAGAA